MQGSTLVKEKPRWLIILVAAALFVATGPRLFAQPAASSSEPIPTSIIDTPLPQRFQEALPSATGFSAGSPILRVAEHIGGDLMLAPSLEGAAVVVNHINSKKNAGNLLIEALVFFAPPPATGPALAPAATSLPAGPSLAPSSSAMAPKTPLVPYGVTDQLDTLGLIFNQFGSLRGIPYWSSSRKISRTLYMEAYRIPSPNDRKKINDPKTVAQLHALVSQKNYLYQKDQTFDGIVTEVECVLSRTGFLMINTNVTPLRLIGIPMLPADGLRTGFFVAPSADGILLYFVTSIKAPSIGKNRVFESASNKALALLHWFVDAATAKHLIKPVSMPWNFDELPPEARLGLAAN